MYITYMYVSVCVYIKRERERERESKLATCLPSDVLFFRLAEWATTPTRGLPSSSRSASSTR